MEGGVGKEEERHREKKEEKRNKREEREKDRLGNERG